MLGRSILMMRTFDIESHILEHQDDISSRILTEVRRTYIHILGNLVTGCGGQSVLIGMEQEKLAFRIDDHRITFGLRLFNRLL